MPDNAIRMEYVVKNVPSAMVVDSLAGQYSRVEFGPTKLGFYALGSREDLRQIKRELAWRDRVPPPPPPPMTRAFRIKYVELETVEELLPILLPEAEYSVNRVPRLLVVKARPDKLRFIKETLAEFDTPELQTRWFLK